MLDLGRYLFGCAAVLLVLGSVWLGAARVRGWLVPGLGGAPAHLATSVLALALALWPAQLLGAFSLLDAVPYAVLVAALGLGLRFGLSEPPAAPRAAGPAIAPGRRSRGPSPLAIAISLAVAAIALLRFGIETKAKLGTGMTGFDTTWYHGPFAAGFLQSGDTWSPHFIAPQFLAWFYPANAEVFHAGGMLAFGRDLLSPLLNFGWLVGCLLACWCIGRPYRVAPWSLALGAVALSLPVLADQAGEMRNDIVGIFFLLTAVALVLNARTASFAGDGAGGERGGGGISAGGVAVAALAAGLAAGTKLNFLLPAAVLVAGLAPLAPAGRRWRSLGLATAAALAGGGFWYLRNLVHSGNPLPWIDSLGPVSPPAPEQAIGGREAHSVLGYLTDADVWSDWFVPGLRDGLTAAWPLFAIAAIAGLLLALLAARAGSRGSFAANGVGNEPHGAGDRSRGSGSTPGVDPEPRDRERDWRLALAGLAGLAAALAWAVAPTSASGPEGLPRGFESGLRYLAPAMVLGLALLPATPPLRLAAARLAAPPLRSESPPRSAWQRLLADSANNLCHAVRLGGTRWLVGAIAAVVLVVAVGYPVQRHYLDHRYTNPTFTDAPGLNAAFRWARDLEGARIATTSTRQYPLYGTDLSNRVQFVGEPRPHGGFVAPSTCSAWRRLLNQGDYDYLVASLDRPAPPGRPAYPATAAWTEGPWAETVLREPPTVVFRLTGNLDPSTCPS